MELLSLISVNGFALFYSRWRRVSASSALLQCVAALLLGLYIAGLANLLLPIALLFMAAGVLLVTVEVWQLIRRRELPPVSISIFAAMGILYWLVHSESELFYYDEYSHWGVYLKEMLASGTLWGKDTNALHPRYFPGTSLWQFFFAINSDRPEGAAYLAQFTFLIAPLMVLWEETSWKKWPWHLGVFALVVIGCFNFGHGFTSLYVDHVLGAWFVGILLNVLLDIEHRSGRKCFAYVLPIAALVLVKTTGVFFALAATGIVSLLLLFGKNIGEALPWKAERWRRAIGFSVITVAACLVIISVWSVNRDAVGAVAESAIGSPTAVATEILSGESILTAQQRTELKRRFLEILLHQQISKDSVSAQYNAFSYPIMDAYTDRFRLTTFSMMGLSLIAILVLWHMVVDRQKRYNWVIAAACTWLAAASYIAALYFGTLFVTTSEYGMLWSSYIRYAHSMLLPVFIICFSGLLPLFAGTDVQPIKLRDTFRVPSSAIVFTVALVTMLVFEPPHLAALYKKQEPHPFRVQTEPITNAVRLHTGSSKLWVFFPNNVENGALGQMLQYQLSPGRVHIEERAERLLENAPDLKSELRNWDYIWFANRSPELRDAESALVGQDVGGGLFRIESASGEIRFTEVREYDPTLLRN